MRLVIKTALVLGTVAAVGILTSPDHAVISTAGATPVPEPSSMALMAAGLGLVGLLRRKSRS